MTYFVQITQPRLRSDINPCTWHAAQLGTSDACLWWGQGGTFHPVPREKPPSWGTAMDRQTLAFVLPHLYYARHQWIEREKKENNSLQLPGSHFIAVANLPSLGSNGKVLSKIKPLDRASGTQSDLLMFSFPCMQWMYGMWGVCVCVCVHIYVLCTA